MNHETNTTGCDDCRYLKGNHCTLWNVMVADPRNSHCDSVRPYYPAANIDIKLGGMFSCPPRSRNA